MSVLLRASWETRATRNGETRVVSFGSVCNPRTERISQWLEAAGHDAAMQTARHLVEHGWLFGCEVGPLRMRLALQPGDNQGTIPLTEGELADGTLARWLCRLEEPCATSR